MKLSFSIACASIVSLVTISSASAFDGWHLENATTIEGKASTFDYISYDQSTNRVFLGHRKEGLQVFDPVTRKIIKVIENTANHSSNGGLLIPDLDLGISNNEDGTITPFKLSTLEAREPIKLAEEIDTSHYDPVTKRIVVNVAHGKDGTDLVVLDATTLKTVGTVKVATRKAEGAEADGKGNMFLSEQDLGKLVKIDTKELKVVAEWSVPGCAKPTAVDIDKANNRIFVGCRGGAGVKPAFVVLNGDTGAVVYSAEIGDGVDGLVYDAELKRVFTANGINANMSIITQKDADNYALSETLGTRAWTKVLAMDHKNKKIYAMTAEGTSDTSKKINTSVTPYYINTVFPNTFTIMTFSK